MLKFFQSPIDQSLVVQLSLSLKECGTKEQLLQGIQNKLQYEFIKIEDLSQIEEFQKVRNEILENIKIDSSNYIDVQKLKENIKNNLNWNLQYKIADEVSKYFTENNQEIKDKTIAKLVEEISPKAIIEEMVKNKLEDHFKNILKETIK